MNNEPMRLFHVTFVFALLLSACVPAMPAGNSAEHSSSSVAVIEDIVINSPVAGTVVKSPLTITGNARGTWFFEASFPVRLLDDTGNEIAATHADAAGDWMTDAFVPFTATLTFTTAAKTGRLVLQKDNPSGLPENDKIVNIPVKF